MSVLDNKYITEMPNGERWAVPVRLIAMDRAKHYAKEFKGDVTESLVQDTAPLFEDSEYEIEDWAKNNMNWSDVADRAERVGAIACDWEEGWVNGNTEIV